MDKILNNQKTINNNMDKKIKIIIGTIFLTLLIFIIFINTSSSSEYPKIDQSICDSEECLINLAIKEENPNYCQGLENKYTCYTAVALRTWDYTLCEKTNNENSRICKITISHDSKDMNSCLKYSYENTMANLMAGKPTKQLCDSVINKNFVKTENGSLVGMATTNDIKECEELESNPNLPQEEETISTLKELCFYEVAINNQNISICEETTIPRKYYCLARIH